MNERTMTVNAAEFQDLVVRIVQAESLLRRVAADASVLPHRDVGGFRTAEVAETTAQECAGFLDKCFGTEDLERMFRV